MEADLAPYLDAMVSVSLKRLDQSAALVDPIPVAPVTVGGGLALWLTPDLRAYASGAVLSRRDIEIFAPTPNPAPPARRSDTLATMCGRSWESPRPTSVAALELDLSVSNPLRRTHYTPYLLDGRPSFTVEPRDASQVFLDLKWSY